jgi:hypothetical protein
MSGIMTVGKMLILSDGQTFGGTDGEARVITYDEALVPVDIEYVDDIPESAIVRSVSINELLECWEKHNG